MDLKNILVLNLKNLQGKRSKRKLLVIECDDWGSIRMPSKEVYNKILKANIPITENRFNRFDTLADKQDLEYLFEILLSVKDKNGHGAVMTAVTNVANPDFKRIKECDFTEYFYEPFIETLKRYNRDPDTFNTWEKGMELGIFIPEIHGREHVSVQFWLQKLREGNQVVREAFEHEFIAVSIDGINPVLNQFRSEFYFNNPEQIEFLKAAISEGVHLFKDIFGYTPRIFVPGNSIFHPVFEKTLAETGVKYIYASTFNPIPGKNGRIKYKYFRNGKKTSHGLIYYTRNCAFEPTDPGYRGIDLTLKQIEAAFRWNKPANISTHRVNFVGGIEQSNREKGLRELKLLLDTIVRNWPDTEFVSSAEMLGEIYPND
ncbi:MAG: hypothetical protein MUO72_10015 [Bacteroidales bacterium]|nr:hypothetical protein [Bacteroidales bacterium]